MIRKRCLSNYHDKIVDLLRVIVEAPVYFDRDAFDDNGVIEDKVVLPDWAWEECYQ